MMEITYKLINYDICTWVIDVVLVKDSHKFFYKTPLLSREQILDEAFIHTSLTDLEGKLLAYTRQTLQS